MDLTIRPAMAVAIFLGLMSVGGITSAKDTVQPQEAAQPETSRMHPLSTEVLTATIRPSMVTIRVRDRDGGELGLGTGFVVDEAGLIATNMHVISEGRAIEAELYPNHPLKVIAIEATSRRDDLALIRVAPDQHALRPIPLGGDETIAQGVEVLAFGNPLGLKHSVVQGVVSATREIDALEMIQVAMPIEPGNSGGPLVDRSGTVRGIVNMKLLEADNVGFAIPISRLKTLLKSTNPIPIDRWVRLAGIDPSLWKPLFGAQWRERSGTISVSESGKGFGGRALCLYLPRVAQREFDVSVQVKLEDESGAAGIVFHADGQDRHYGFYPSAGNLRLTCFQGPSVYSWEVLADVPSKHYLPGQWNQLKVRVSPGKIRCFVNGHQVIESEHEGLVEGQVGLAKFRNTQAEFRGFRTAPRIDDDQLSDGSLTWFEGLPRAEEISKLDETAAIQQLSQDSSAASRELLKHAELLKRESARLMRMAEDVRLTPVLRQLSGLFDSVEQDDLLVGALLIAALDHPDLDIATYQRRLDSMAAEVKSQLTESADEEQRIRELDRYLFEQNGFHGSRDEYYHEANNHLDRVIDDREGMPITLALLYMELGRRLNLAIEGVGLPGHFVVRFRMTQDGQEKSQLIDVFDKARRMSEDEAAQLITINTQRLPRELDYRAQEPSQILLRILHNLISSAERNRDFDAIRRYTEGMVALNDDDPEYRLRRAIIRYQTGRFTGAAEDLDWLLDKLPAEVDSEQIRRLRDQIQRERI